MKTLQETVEEIEMAGNEILDVLGLKQRLKLSAPADVTDHYAFTGFLGETEVHMGINGRGNATKEYLPDLLDAIKESLAHPLS